MLSYLGLRSKTEVNEVIVGVVTTVLPALRLALDASDLDAALSQVKGFATQLKTDAVQTPSNAPQGFVRQLIRLAMEKSSLPKLLREFHKTGLLTKWALECVISECAKKGDTKVLWEAKEFAQSQGVEVTPAGFYALIRSAATNEAVLELYDAHCKSFDVCANGPGGRVIAEAAFSCNRPEVISQMLAKSTEAKQVALLKSFSSEGRKKESLAIFKACPKKNGCHYSIVVDVCITTHDIALAERLVSEAAEAGIVDAMAYDSIIKAYLQAKDLRGARRVLNKLQSTSVVPTSMTFNRLIDATLKVNIDDAWELVRKMQECGLKPNGITCSILLKCIQWNSRPIDIKRTFALLDQNLDDMDEVLLGSTCEACIRVGRVDMLRQLLQRQRSTNKIPVKGAHTFGSLIRANGFIKDIKGAWEMWLEMRGFQVIPTTVTIGTMVEALVSNGDPDAGYSVITEVLHNEQTRSLVNAVIYCSVMKGFSRQKRFDCVWALYQEMIEEKITFSVNAYDAIIDACARNGEMNRLPPILKDMYHRKVEPNRVTFSTIIKGYCNEGQIDKALELFEHMKKTKDLRPDEGTYNTLLDGCARLGYYERGMALLDVMQHEEVAPNNFTLSVILKLAGRSLGSEKAFELSEEISQKYQIDWNVHVYNSAMQVYISGGLLLQRALRLFEQMLRKQVYPDSRTYTILLRGCIRAKAGRDAAGLLRAAMGLPGAHFRISALSPASYKLQGGLSQELIAEVVEGIAAIGSSHNEEMLAALKAELRDMKRN